MTLMYIKVGQYYNYAFYNQWIKHNDIISEIVYCKLGNELKTETLDIFTSLCMTY